MFCSKCGKQIDDDSKFCPFCGNIIKKSAATGKVPNKGAKRPFPVIWAVCGAGAVVILIVACTFMFRTFSDIEDGSDKEFVAANAENAESNVSEPSGGELKTLTQADAQVIAETWVKIIANHSLTNISMLKEDFELKGIKGFISPKCPDGGSVKSSYSDDCTNYSWSGLAEVSSVANMFTGSYLCKFSDFDIKNYSFDTIEYTSGDPAEFWVLGVAHFTREITNGSQTYDGNYVTGDLYLGFRFEGMQDNRPVWNIFSMSTEEPGGVEWAGFADSKQKPENHDSDTLYSITSSDINDILSDFFQLHLGCYIAYAMGKCDTEPVNISTMLENSVVQEYNIVNGILDSRMRVAAGYNDNVFQLQMTASNLFNRIQGKKEVAYHCTVEVVETNITGYTFRYYEGTDAEIGAVARLHYYIDDVEIGFGNNYAAVQLVNSSENPEEWLIKGALLTTEQAYQQNIGDIFTAFLVDEDIDESALAIDWKQAYLSGIPENQLTDGLWGMYSLEDINGDNIPEIYYIISERNSLMYYILKDGTVGSIDGGSYSSDKIWSSSEGMGVISDEVYQYDSSTGDYLLIFHGYRAEGGEASMNNEQCSSEEYAERLNTLTEGEEWDYWECVQTSDKRLIDAIADY